MTWNLPGIYLKPQDVELELQLGWQDAKLHRNLNRRTTEDLVWLKFSLTHFDPLYIFIVEIVYNIAKIIAIYCIYCTHYAWYAASL